MAPITHYECISCVRRTPATDAPGECPHCEGPLLARYDMQALRHEARRPPAHHAPDHSMRRYRAVLPDFEPLSLAEANTPMLRSRQMPRLSVKLENRSACGTGLVRGMGMAIAWHQRAGYRRFASAADGAEAVAFAACAAAFGVEAHLFLPRDAALDVEVRSAVLGAQIVRVQGGLEACATELRRHSGPERWCDLSSAAHPLRIEGDKTVGFEIADQLGWCPPYAVLCPPQTALAVAKAFEELRELGWLEGDGMPRLYITHAAHAPRAGRWAREAAERSGGGTCMISAERALEELRAWPGEEGFLLSPEGAAGAACYRDLLARGALRPEHPVVLIDNGQVAEATQPLAKALGLERHHPLPPRMPVGGIITPQ